MVKTAKFIMGAILAQGIALGTGALLVWLIPIRGTELAIIVCPVICAVMLVFTYLLAVKPLIK